MRTRLYTTLLVAAGLGLTACGGGGGDGGNGPQAGSLDVNLTTAATGPGAILFTISGGEVTSVSAVGGYHLYETAINSTTRKVLVTGDIVAGPVVTIAVPDVNKAGNYSVSVNQVAARGSAPVAYQQLGTAGFGMAVTP